MRLGGSTRNTEVIRWRSSETWKSDRDRTLAMRGLSRKWVWRCAFDMTEEAVGSAAPQLAHFYSGEWPLFTPGCREHSELTGLCTI